MSGIILIKYSCQIRAPVPLISSIASCERRKIRYGVMVSFNFGARLAADILKKDPERTVTQFNSVSHHSRKLPKGVISMIYFLYLYIDSVLLHEYYGCFMSTFHSILIIIYDLYNHVLNIMTFAYTLIIKTAMNLYTNMVAISNSYWRIWLNYYTIL